MSNEEVAKDKKRSWMMPKLTRPGSSSGRATSNGSPASRPGSSSGVVGTGLFSKLGAGSSTPSLIQRTSSFNSILSLSSSSSPSPGPVATPSPESQPRAPAAPGRPPLQRQGSSNRPPPSAFSLSSRNQSFDSPPASIPATPKRRLSNTVANTVLPQDLNDALERTQPRGNQARPESSRFGKSITSMMSGLALSRTSTRESTTVKDDEGRGRTLFSPKRWRSASQSVGPDSDVDGRSRSRARSQSPFILKRWRARDSSPPIGRVSLNQSDAELSEAESTVAPRSAYQDRYYDEEALEDDDDGASDDSLSDEDYFDPITERNTEQNAIIAPDPSEAVPEVEDPDPVGEGVNVIIAPEPYFPTSLNSLGSKNKRNPRRRKTLRSHEPLPLVTSRPAFQRDRCTITITQGDPDKKLKEEGRKKRRYVVASDLSEESRYAVEWGIGTVLRDGDEMLLVTIVENDQRIDPTNDKPADRHTKLRSQQERQGMAYILARQVTSLLQRTRLHVTVACQAWHAKHARHMLLDIVDYMEPTMMIVGSRGLSQLNGILLGSTSHYLIERASVPVMVARRRLKRPPRRAAHLSTSRTRVKLAEAGIDRVAGKVDQDVEAMRDELQKEDQRRTGGPGSRDGLRNYAASASGDEVREDDEADGEDDDDDEPQITVHGP
ncbi:hypothetical protein FA13DRAFT_1784541 [Coprinellus micaceus]|uniref:UspA domain-containing protein n=1 Tax=Coprinellus micaceus TaxID=71717 RepID=A0A4Y7U229_COPMI|nr:hypothetical protein FA13DRAFT_1784541 [Coprinellus micaceus]